MKEYKVLIHIPTFEKQWYVASGRNCRPQPVHKTKEDAEAWIKKMEEYHEKQNHSIYLGATYKIMSREVSEWEDAE